MSLPNAQDLLKRAFYKLSEDLVHNAQNQASSEVVGQKIANLNELARLLATTDTVAGGILRSINAD